VDRVGASRRPFLRRKYRRMTNNSDLNVELQGADIVVTLPGTDYTATYYGATNFPQQLLSKSYSGSSHTSQSRVRQCA
jgi:hypothetical protein